MEFVFMTIIAKCCRDLILDLAPDLEMAPRASKVEPKNCWDAHAVALSALGILVTGGIAVAGFTIPGLSDLQFGLIEGGALLTLVGTIGTIAYKTFPSTP